MQISFAILHDFLILQEEYSQNAFADTINDTVQSFKTLVQSRASWFPINQQQATSLQPHVPAKYFVKPHDEHKRHRQILSRLTLIQFYWRHLPAALFETNARRLNRCRNNSFLMKKHSDTLQRAALKAVVTLHSLPFLSSLHSIVPQPPAKF